MDQTNPPTPALAYDGRLGDLYRLFLTNLVLTILTLGVFRFWAITRTRRYLWSHLAFQGRRLAYTGTGGELFLAFLLAALALLVMALAAGALAYVLPGGWNVIPLILLYAAVIVLAAGAPFAAQRYRLGRTQWSGVHGGMTGSALAYGVRVIAYALLLVLSLLQLGPWVSVRLAEARIDASSFGTVQFSFRGRARALYPAYVLTFLANAVLFAAVATLVFAAVQPVLAYAAGAASTDDTADRMAQFQGALYVVAAALLAYGVLASLVACWYTALLTRHIVGNTALGPLRFASSITGHGLLRLTLGNILILIATVGLGYPIAIHRSTRYLAETLFAYGALDPAGLAQSPRQDGGNAT